MSYTALKAMRDFIGNVLTVQTSTPMSWTFFDIGSSDLKSAALRFIHDCCENLKFDLEKENKYETGYFTGTSKNSHQIPYNMQACRELDEMVKEFSEWSLTREYPFMTIHHSFSPKSQRLCAINLMFYHMHKTG